MVLRGEKSWRGDCKMESMSISGIARNVHYNRRMAEIPNTLNYGCIGPEVKKKV